jgi:hypothetical protein
MLGLWTKSKAKSEPKGKEAPSVELLTFRRHHYPDPKPMSEVASIYYAAGGTAHHLTASITWRALALLRRELIRRGEELPDDELVEQVLCRYVQDQLESRPLTEARDEEELCLDFHGGPNASGPREMLQRCGILASN